MFPFCNSADKAGVISGSSTRSIHKKLLIFSVVIFSPSILNAQGLDPLCDHNVGKGEWGVGGGFTQSGSNTQIAQVFAEREKLADNKYASITPGILSSRNFFSLHAGVERIIPPIPVPNVYVEDDLVPVVPKPDAIRACTDAIDKLQSKTALSMDRTYACALLDVDRKCLTGAESQPHVASPSVPKRSLAVAAINGKAFCTALLLDEKQLLTARHCFVNPKTGELHPELTAAISNGFNLETIDGMREIKLKYTDISSLQLLGGFDIDKDPVILPASTSLKSGALPLPKVELIPAKENQLLWIAGVVPLLDQAIAMQRKAVNSAIDATGITWRESIRWSSSLGAQCRIIKVAESCIYHSCQTFKGFSGSPMIVSARADKNGDPAVIEYVGIHSGTPGRSKPDGWPACSRTSDSFKVSDYLVFNVGKEGN